MPAALVVVVPHEGAVTDAIQLDVGVRQHGAARRHARAARAAAVVGILENRAGERGAMRDACDEHRQKQPGPRNGAASARAAARVVAMGHSF